MQIQGSYGIKILYGHVCFFFLAPRLHIYLLISSELPRRHFQNFFFFFFKLHNCEPSLLARLRKRLFFLLLSGYVEFFFATPKQRGNLRANFTLWTLET